MLAIYAHAQHKTGVRNCGRGEESSSFLPGKGTFGIFHLQDGIGVAIHIEMQRKGIGIHSILEAPSAKRQEEQVTLRKDVFIHIFRSIALSAWDPFDLVRG
jgi:hypothetical protein